MSTLFIAVISVYHDLEFRLFFFSHPRRASVIFVLRCWLLAGKETPSYYCYRVLSSCFLLLLFVLRVLVTCREGRKEGKKEGINQQQIVHNVTYEDNRNNNDTLLLLLLWLPLESHSSLFFVCTTSCRHRRRRPLVQSFVSVGINGTTPSNSTRTKQQNKEQEHCYQQQRQHQR